jgi:hypothetical protein
MVIQRRVVLPVNQMSAKIDLLSVDHSDVGDE